MTHYEQQMISRCRIAVTGDSCSAAVIADMAADRGLQIANTSPDIIIDASSDVHRSAVPVIYPVDLLEYAAVLTVAPGNDISCIVGRGRVGVARYIAGYNMFWQVEEDIVWDELLARVAAGETSAEAMRLAAMMSVRVAARIAVGLPIKQMPRFYLASPSQIRR